MRLIAALLVALVPAIAFAEENCGRMFRTVTRFRGIVRVVEPIAGRDLLLAPVDLDPRYVAAIDVLSAPSGDRALREENTYSFGIHSPSRTFGPEHAVGKTFDLEVQWNACDGTFRRFEELRRLPAARLVEDYDGSVEVGHSYRADVHWENDVLGLVTHLDPPHHHSIGAHFENVDAFPELQQRDVAHTVVFEVLSQEIEILEPGQWLNSYVLSIIESGS
ncbi:MAG TPA: hypothetical protein VFP80_10295 [Thermoanaerobaculia bacterium]|nr:hypothetical protein [Thermoanaerobaculia bacterium]